MQNPEPKITKMKYSVKVQVVLDVVLVVSTTFMVLLAPYTKVEESFNVQALHDFINVGVDEIMLFDHVTFPGSVKRTCLGILFLSLPSIFFRDTMKKWAGILVSLAILLHRTLPTSIGMLSYGGIEEMFTMTKLPQLIVTRFLLAIFTCVSLIHLRRSVLYSCSQNSRLIGLWFSLLLYPLPHIIFYSSRFLPNFLCFPLTNLGIALFISGDITRSLTILVFTGIVFRFEVLIFTGILIVLCISGFFRDGNSLISIREAIVSVGVSGIMSIFLCSRVDSYFWDVKFVIPEFESFVFNVIGGNSSDWGVESPMAYFTKYLPKLFAAGFGVVLILSLVFFILSLLNLKMFYWKKERYRFEVDYVNYGVGTITTLMWAALIYICVLSVNGHKEWRFLIYTVPILCIGAASTAEWMMSKSKILKRLMITLIILCYTFSLASSFFFGYISSWNYPGGDACQKLNLRLIDMYGSSQGTMLKPLIVHWDVGTCMNGGSLFTQISDNKVLGDGWLEEEGGREPKFWVIYDKNEDSEVLSEIVDDFDYWIQYDDEEIIPLSEGYQWLLVDVSEGFTGVDYKFLVDTLKNPRKIGLQLLLAIKTGDTSWFKNVADSVIKKKVRGRIWERSAADKVFNGL